MKLHIRLLLISATLMQPLIAMEEDKEALVQRQIESQNVFHAFQKRDFQSVEAFIRTTKYITQPIIFLDPEKPCEGFKSKTLLELACASNMAEIVYLLRERNVDIAGADEDGNTPLAREVARKSLDSDTLIALITEQTINMQNKRKSTPLHMLLYQPEVNFLNLDLLCEQGASLELQDAAGNTPIHYAVLKDPTGKILNIMLRIPKKVADAKKDEDRIPPTCINSQNGQGATPLHLAIAQYLDAPEGTDYLNPIERLLDLGADLSIKNTQGLTPVDLYQYLLSEDDQRAQKLDKFMKAYYELEQPAEKTPARRGSAKKEISFWDELVSVFSPEQTESPEVF